MTEDPIYPDPYQEHVDKLLVEEHEMHPERFHKITMNTLHPNDPKAAAGAKKTPLHLIPKVALYAAADALKLGAGRYGAWNWRQTRILSTTYHGALLRHITAWGSGEDLDPDSGLPHLGLAMANLCIILDAGDQGTLVDDRPKSAEREPAIPGIPDGLPPLPPVPEGYSRWEYRGTEWLHKKTQIAYLSLGSEIWDVYYTRALGAPGHYLEAVK